MLIERLAFLRIFYVENYMLLFLEISLEKTGKWKKPPTRTNPAGHID